MSKIWYFFLFLDGFPNEIATKVLVSVQHYKVHEDKFAEKGYKVHDQKANNIFFL